MPFAVLIPRIGPHVSPGFLNGFGKLAGARRVADLASADAARTILGREFRLRRVEQA